jgi:hypothetical protein
MTSLITLHFLAVSAIVGFTSTAHAQTARADTLIGRVVDSASVAVSDAEIIVTRGPDRAIFRSRGDSQGHWSIVVPDGTGDYLVYVSAPARVAERRRVTRTSGAPFPLFVFTLRLASPTALDRVTIVASRRETPARTGDGLEASRGDAEFERDVISTVASPADAGNLALAANGTPGFAIRDGRLTTLGVPGTQSLITLNGLAFPGGELPRGMRTSVRTAATAWDVSRGGFSGARLDASLGTGSPYFIQSLSVSGDSPLLQVTDAVGRSGAAVFGRVDLNAASSGPLGTGDRFAYAVGARLRRRVSEIDGFESAPAGSLVADGIDPDSADRLRSSFPALGLSFGDATSRRVRDEIQLVGRIDKLGYDMQAFREHKRTYGAVFFASGDREAGAGLGPSIVSSAVPLARGGRLGIQGLHSFKGGRWLQESKFGINTARSVLRPREMIPFATTLLSGESTSSNSLGQVAFGGGDGTSRNSSSVSLEATHEMQANLDGKNNHRLKLFFQGRLDFNSDAGTPNSLGFYSFRSLNDVVSGTPATFQRSFYSDRQRGGVANAAIGVGSVYRPSSYFSLQYGLRVDASANLLSQGLDSRLVPLTSTVDADRSTLSSGVSPRIGFRWVLSRKAQPFRQPVYSPIGQFARQTSGTLRGGVGLFRGFLDVNAVTLQRDSSGEAATGVRTVRCIGPAVPSPDWNAFRASASSIPRTCNDGFVVLVDDRPALRLVGRNFRPAESWRANLAYSMRVIGTDFDVEVIGSLNERQPSSIDANFAPRTTNRLNSEAGRPVFVPFSVIDPATGLVPFADRTAVNDVGAVSILKSSGRSRAAQIRVTLTPFASAGRLVRFSWVAAVTRAKVNGFDASTSDDPRRNTWAASPFDSRHQLIAQAGWNLGSVSAEAFLRIESGVPFSPLIRGDINGDGLSFNDRAYVPGRGDSDSVLQAAIGRVANASRPSIRKCLNSAVGQVAELNTCRGPWTVQSNLRLSISGTALRLPSGSRLALFVENPLGGLDRLLHRNRLRGWGTSITPDPFLLSVQGWDPSRNRYQYVVNERFAATDSRLSTLRAPLRVTLDAEIPFGTSIPAQLLDRTLRRGRNPRGDSGFDTLAVRKIYERTVPNLFDEILSEGDSLLLTPFQIERLERERTVYVQQVRAAWSAFARVIATQGAKYSAGIALREQESTAKVVTEVARQAALGLDKLLTPVQLRLLPYPAGFLRKAKRGGILRQIAN